MKLEALIMYLTDIQDSLQPGEDPDVLLAHQPSWPFEYAISTVEAVRVSDEDDFDLTIDEVEDLTSDEKDDYERRLEAARAEAKTVVYIAEGEQLAYLHGAATHALGWGR